MSAASRPSSSADVVDETAGVGANQGRRRGRDTAKRDYWFRAAGVRGRTPPLPRTEASASGSSHACFGATWQSCRSGWARAQRACGFADQRAPAPTSGAPGNRPEHRRASRNVYGQRLTGRVQLAAINV